MNVAWRTGALGDFVLTLPVLDRLADDGPLTVVAPLRYRAFFGRAAEWVDADGAALTAWFAGRVTRTERWGVAWTATAADALRACGVARVTLGPTLPAPGVHAADSLWEPLCERFGARDRDPRINTSPSSDPAAPVVLAPGSGGAAKRWPLDRWRAVASRLNRPVLWVGGPNERDEGGWGIPRRDDLDLAGLVALAGRCAAWLGPDSGPCHLARAVGARVGVVFGHASDPTQWAPLGATVFRWDIAPERIADWANAP